MEGSRGADAPSAAVAADEALEIGPDAAPRKLSNSLALSSAAGRLVEAAAIATAAAAARRCLFVARFESPSGALAGETELKADEPAKPDEADACCAEDAEADEEDEDDKESGADEDDEEACCRMELEDEERVAAVAYDKIEELDGCPNRAKIAAEDGCSPSCACGR